MVPTRKTSEQDLNQFNITLRSQPWYQDYFKSRGLNPNKVKLSRRQQGELEQLMARNGMPVHSGMHIDNAGNVNQKNRLGKIAAVAAPVAASMLIPGVREAVLSHAGSLFGVGGGGGGGTATGTVAGAGMSVPELGVGAIPSVLGPGITEAAPWLMPSSMAAAAPSAASKVAQTVAPEVAKRGGHKLLVPILGASGALASTVGEQMGANKRHEQDLALAESELDPHRAEMMQANDISRLDTLQHRTPYALEGQTVTGGYNPSPEARDMYGQLKQRVAGNEMLPSSVPQASAVPPAPMPPAPNAPGLSYDDMLTDPRTMPRRPVRRA